MIFGVLNFSQLDTGPGLGFRRPWPTLCACIGRRSRDPSSQEMGQNGRHKRMPVSILQAMNSPPLSQAATQSLKAGQHFQLNGSDHTALVLLKDEAAQRECDNNMNYVPLFCMNT
ncbi:hypothetical protein NPIL_137931 [Nephila pilipes]|uniref:Uncharacterized protein n=1 Tax=Nephila pilipes TaxID=299642 RepID=A0A8X6Q633_NEPPI|nr:hypothetical protein NPIL_137931 [Nephila pilipes]